MTLSMSLLGGHEQQSSRGALAERFLAAPDVLKSSEASFQPLDMFAPLPIGPATRSEAFSQKFRSTWSPDVSIIVISSSQQGFSPRGDARISPELAISEPVNQQLRSQACDEKPRSKVDLAPSRSRFEDDRMPYVSMIREMLDQDQVAAARTLLSVALAESPNNPELLRTAEVLAVPKSVRRPVQDSDRRREYSWLAAHANSHRGKWVAIFGSELLGSAASLAELLELLKSSGTQRVALIHRVV